MHVFERFYACIREVVCVLARSCVFEIMRVLVSYARIRDIACILIRLHVLVIAYVLLYGCGSSSDCKWMCMCALKKDSATNMMSYLGSKYYNNYHQ